MNELVRLTIRQAAGLIAAGKVRPSELVEAALERIEETEPAIQAYVTVMAGSARAAARQADAELPDHSRGPLHGIPIAVKDAIFTRDAPTQAGSAVLAGFESGWDATVVARLRDAGAIIIGKTET